LNFQVIQVHAFIKGINKDKLRVDVKDNYVILDGIREDFSKDEQNNYWTRLKERQYGHFYRRFRMPKESQMEKTIAMFNNGLLVVKIPKSLEHTTKIAIA
jgi:HSP20 family protein